MFCLNLSEKQNLNLKIPVDSNLDKIFYLEEYKESMPNNVVNIFSELFDDDLNTYKAQDESNLINSINLLYNKSIDFPINSILLYL